MGANLPLTLLFLTTTNLATNPRLYKEACLALDNGFSIFIIQFKFGNWSDEKTEVLIQALKDRNVSAKVNIHWIDATKSNKVCWLYSGLLERAC